MSKLFSFFSAIFFILLGFQEGCCQAGCFFQFIDFPDKEPVLIDSDYNLIEPEGRGVSLEVNEQLFLFCPGSNNNFLLFPTTNLVSARCSQTNLLNINGVDYDLKKLNCSKSVTGEVLVTTISCGMNRGVIKYIGYNIINPIISKWLTLFYVCYDNNRGETIYSNHTLYGSAILYAKKESNRPAFKSAGLGPGVSADTAYTQLSQKATFLKLLGTAEVTDNYINTNSYLARGHLSPDGDFIFVSYQFTSYFYINTVPQWQVINNGNWKSVEQSIRNVAASSQSSFKILTGGFDTLVLKDTFGIGKEIYLISAVNNNKLPVNKYVWKIAYNSVNNKAIAFVNQNNPFIGAVPENDYLCTDICAQYGWGSSAWKNSAKGLVYCCDVKDLRNVIPTIPYIQYSGILNAN